jgi:hypothetical protein
MKAYRPKVDIFNRRYYNKHMKIFDLIEEVKLEDIVKTDRFRL